MSGEGKERNPDCVTYLDAAAATKRLGGNIALYQKLLDSFFSGSYVSDLHAQIAQGNLEEAAKAAHALKGVSANLSLTELNRLSFELEQDLKAGLLPTNQLAALEQALEATRKEAEALTQ